MLTGKSPAIALRLDFVALESAVGGLGRVGPQGPFLPWSWAALIALLSVGFLGCRGASPSEAQAEPKAEVRKPEPEPEPEPGVDPKAPLLTEGLPARERLDVHVHLVEDAVDELLAALDRSGIHRAVVMASPHLDGAHPPPPGTDKFADWRQANDRLLALTAAHRDRLLPFITADPATVTVAELERWQAAGACGLKLYAGHHNLHPRPLADPAHAPLFGFLEAKQVPVLLHVNTFRYEDELDALLQAYPALALVCPHLCGSRTDLDRLERLLRKHPRLLVDSSHGPGKPGIDGFLNLEREHERLRALIAAEPGRFLFGSDLVTMTVANSLETSRIEWDQQVRANIGLLERERYEYLRPQNQQGGMVWGEYRGLALDEAALGSVMAGNAERWLAGCIAAEPRTSP